MTPARSLRSEIPELRLKVIGEGDRLAESRQLVDRLGLDNLRIDGLTLPEFMAMAFAIFSYGNSVQKENVSRVVLDPAVFFREFPKALLVRRFRG